MFCIHLNCYILSISHCLTYMGARLATKERQTVERQVLEVILETSLVLFIDLKHLNT